MNIIVYTDGGSRGNPGQAAIGGVILSQDKKIIFEFSKKIGIATNNEAEYKAVVYALSWILQSLLFKKNTTTKSILDVSVDKNTTIRSTLDVDVEANTTTKPTTDVVVETNTSDDLNTRDNLNTRVNLNTSASFYTNADLEKIDFYLDSKLVVEQVNKKWKIKELRMRLFAEEIWDLVKQIGATTSFYHIPRSENKKADLLVNTALDSA